jgi:hypothetical protein
MTAFTQTDMDNIVKHLIVALLWSSTDDSDIPLDSNYGAEDIAPEALATIKEQTQCFCESEYKNLQAFMRLYHYGTEQIGHDLWLTSQGHGAGFWDRGNNPVTASLTIAAKVAHFGDPYIGDDGKIHLL